MTIDLGNRLLLRTREERERIQQPAEEQFRRPLLTVDMSRGVIESRMNREPVSRGEDQQVTRHRSRIEWPTREQVTTALAEHETQGQVTAALGLRIHQLRTAIERVGLEWPWQGAGKPRLDRVAPTEDKPEAVPAAAETTPAKPETEPSEPVTPVVVHQTTAKAEAAAAADVGDVPLGPPPELAPRRVDHRGRTVADGLTISLPRTMLDSQAADRLLAQIRDTITVAGGPVELAITARVGVGGRG